MQAPRISDLYASMEVEAGEGTTQGASYNAAKAPEGIAHPGELPKIVEHYLITGMSWW